MCVYVSSKAKEELSKGQPSLTIMTLHLPAVSNFGEKSITCFQEASTSPPNSSLTFDF